MSQPAETLLNVDVTRITDAETRRALRNAVQQMQQVVDRQQIEIEALLEMMLEKHIGSLGEFKRHVQKIQQRQTERAGRVHSRLYQNFVDASPAPTPSTAKPMPPMSADTGEEDDHPVYRL